MCDLPQATHVSDRVYLLAEYVLTSIIVGNIRYGTHSCSDSIPALVHAENIL